MRAPSSKSETNRALVLAALSATPVVIANPLESGDTRALSACLRALGARIESSAGGVTVCGPLRGADDEIALDAGESGTAARFLAAIAAATPGRFRLDGAPRLRERPMAGLLDALRSAGARIACPGEDGFLPLEIAGGGLRPGAEVAVDAGRSSQFLSALLLAGVAVEGGLAVRPTGAVVSEPYVATTLSTLASFGHVVERRGAEIRVTRGPAPAARFEVAGDDSAAIPLFAAVGTARGRVLVRGIRADSPAADARARPVLEAMGISLSAAPGGVAASFAGGPLRPVRVEAAECPDAVPALAALAAFAAGGSRFDRIGHLRWKESDRIGALIALIRAAGGAARADGDALVVAGGGIRPGGGADVLPTFGDHRIAMAAGLLAIGAGGYAIENPDCVGKSYPGFFRDLASLLRS